MGGNHVLQDRSQREKARRADFGTAPPRMVQIIAFCVRFLYRYTGMVLPWDISPMQDLSLPSVLNLNGFPIVSRSQTRRIHRDGERIALTGKNLVAAQ
jgi:hypothetical protein